MRRSGMPGIIDNTGRDSIQTYDVKFSAGH
jgi:hypothetical protein